MLGGRGVLLAHESFHGARTFHVYTDGEDQTVDATLAQWAGGHGLTIESVSDPGWTRSRRFTS